MPTPELHDHASHRHVDHEPASPPAPSANGRVTAVLEASGLPFATEKAVVESMLGRLPGVASVEANPVAQTATVTYDPQATSIAELRAWVEQCGYHCAGQSVPEHVCAPLEEPAPEAAAHVAHEHAGEAVRAPHEVMGHGGHAGMSMAAMVADMRRRFLVGAVFSVAILLWSRIGREVLGFDVDAPFGLSDEWFQLILSLPVVLWADWIFFDGAVRALRARTLDMMVLVGAATTRSWPAWWAACRSRHIWARTVPFLVAAVSGRSWVRGSVDGAVAVEVLGDDLDPPSTPRSRCSNRSSTPSPSSVPPSPT